MFIKENFDTFFLKNPDFLGSKMFFAYTLLKAIFTRAYKRFIRFFYLFKHYKLRYI